VKHLGIFVFQILLQKITDYELIDKVPVVFEHIICLGFF
jgi:hypothetical protein